MPSIRVALAQLNSTVGDFADNSARILSMMSQCEQGDVDLAVFPELAITGYPPEDLVLRKDFVAANADALNHVASYSERTASVIGFVDHDTNSVFNAAAMVHDGQVAGITHKRLLPNYSVFDEQRTFTAGTIPSRLYEVAGVRIGVVVCQDAWDAEGPMRELSHGGAELIVVINASPFYGERWRDRIRVMKLRAQESRCTLIYLNCVGGQDELVFDGGSFVLSPAGELVAVAPQFSEHLSVIDLTVEPASRVHSIGFPLIELSPITRATDRRWPSISSWLDTDEEIYQALVMGTRDYVRKNGFSDVVVGLSGGIDSSLVACIAADALGNQHVHGVMMPSPFTSAQSTKDATELAKALNIDLRTHPISDLFVQFKDTLSTSFGELPDDVTEENLQSRIRGSILMALSNKFNWLVLTTGNKSELATGFCTLYGDTVGGFGVIKDILKTRVYELARLRNERGDQPIPADVLTRPPTAELRENQRDDQSLPPYEVLDPIIQRYVEQDESVESIVSAGFNVDVVKRVASLVKSAEYKRRQLPPGIRISDKAFGKDRRVPITNRFNPQN